MKKCEYRFRTIPFSLIDGRRVKGDFHYDEVIMAKDNREAYNILNKKREKVEEEHKFIKVALFKKAKKGFKIIKSWIGERNSDNWKILTPPPLRTIEPR